MSQINDPASDAAKKQSNNSLNSPVQQCPLQAEWLSIKPMRYGVDEKDSGITVSKDLQISGMPNLTDHQYIVRELAEQYVYLYHPEEHYLLEVHYAGFRAPIGADEITGSCIFGDPDLTDPEHKNVTTALAASPALLKQKRGDQVVMWLTHAPLTKQRIADLKANPALIEKAGQNINLANAAQDKQYDAFPLFKAKDIIAELTESEEENLLSWTATPLVCKIDENSLTGDHNKATPDNSYGIVLIDAIGITSDLCRQFTATAQHIINAMSVAQHPYNMANLSKQMVEKIDAGQKAAIKQNLEAVKFGYELAGDNIVAESLSDKHILESQLQKASEKTRSCLHIDKLEEYITNYQTVSSELENELENFAKDWLKWLEHDELDLALSWLDDRDPEQIAHKESFLMAITNGMELTEKGTDMLDSWTEKMLTLMQNKSTLAKGAAAHLNLSLGFAESIFLGASKWLKEFNAFINIDPEAANSERKSLLQDGKIPASPALDSLIESISQPFISKTHDDPESFNKMYSMLAYRYDYKFATMNVPMDELALSIKASSMVMIYSATGRVPNAASLIADNSRQLLLNLEDPIKATEEKTTTFTRNQTQHAKFWAKQMYSIGEEMPKTRAAFEAAHAKMSEKITPSMQNKFVGLFFFAQVYNIFKTTKQFEENQGKYTLDLISGWLGIINASFAAIDQIKGDVYGKAGSQKFSGYLQSEWADEVGELFQKSFIKMQNLIQSEAVESIEYANIGKKVTSSIRLTVRWMPVAGDVVGAFSSLQKLFGTKNQNLVGKRLSVLNLMLSTGAAYFSILALIPGVGQAMAMIALVLSLATVVVQTFNSMLSYTEAELLLRGTYWGTGHYDYHELNGLEEKANYFSQDLSQNTEPLTIINKELTACTDFLFKPVAEILEQKHTTTTSKGKEITYTDLILKFTLPGFLPLQSNVSMLIHGYGLKTKTLLYSQSVDKQFKATGVAGQLEINENEKGQLVSQLVFVINESEMKRDYKHYELALEYKNPAGFPITLSYPKIAMDDKKRWLWLFGHTTAISAFQVKGSEKDLISKIDMEAYTEMKEVYEEYDMAGTYQ